MLRLGFEAKAELRRGHPSVYLSKMKEAYRVAPDEGYRLSISRLIAQFYRTHGREDEALPIYRRLVDKTDRIQFADETDSLILCQWAELELSHGTAKSADEGFERAIAEASWYEKTWPPFPGDDNGTRARAHYIAARTCEKDTFRLQDSVEEYKTALKLSSGNNALKYVLARDIERCEPSHDVTITRIISGEKPPSFPAGK